MVNLGIVDLPLSADIQGECGNLHLGNFTAGILAQGLQPVNASLREFRDA